MSRARFWKGRPGANHQVDTYESLINQVRCADRLPKKGPPMSLASMRTMYQGDPTLRPLPPGKKVLVVGGMVNSALQEWKDDPRLVLRDLKPEQYRWTGEIPAEVVQVVLSRFVSHTVRDHLFSLCKARNIWLHPIPYSTGQLRKAISILFGKDEPITMGDVLAMSETPALNPLGTALRDAGVTPSTRAPHPPQEIPMPANNVGPQDRPTMVNYVRSHWDLGPTEAFRAMAVRIMPAVRAAGFTPTEASLAKCIQVEAQGRGITRPRGQTGKRRGMGGPKATLAATERSPRAKRPSASPNKESIFRQIDEAIAAMQLVREAVEQLESSDQTLVQLKKLLGVQA